jgi:hypothetical protein
MKKILFLLTVVISAGCSNDSLTPSNAEYEARWKSQQIFNYTMVQSRKCFCPNGGQKVTVVVQNNLITDVRDPNGQSLPVDSQKSYKTVDELFAIIRSVDPAKVATLNVLYDKKLGYPTNLYVDVSKQIADEEYGYSVENLQPK